MVRTIGKKECETILFIPQTSIPTPEEGIIIYDDNVSKLKYYNGTDWVEL